MGKKLSTKQFNELKKIVEAQGADFQKFAEGSEEYRQQAIKEGYESYKEKFPEVYGLPVDPTPDPDVPPTPTCGGHSHWDGSKCVCDPGYHDVNGECIADEEPPGPDVPPEPPAPNPAGVIYDSNTDGKWNDGNSRVVKGNDGDIKPNGKGIFTAASGSPEVHIDGKGTAILVTKPGFGRFYLCVTNFNAQLDFDFNIMDSSVDNMSIKGRSRHQAGGAPDNRFGGLGNATSTKDTDFKIEEYHNVHQQGYNKTLPTPLKVGEWYSKRYIYHNTPDDKGIKMEDWIDFKDGKGLVKVFERTETKPIAASMDKAMFDQESWIWFRLNGSGSIGFKNVKVTAL